LRLDGAIRLSEMGWIGVVEWAKVVIIVGTGYPHRMENSLNEIGWAEHTEQVAQPDGVPQVTCCIDLINLESICKNPLRSVSYFLVIN
jgi:hypothetical protein